MGVTQAIHSCSASPTLKNSMASTERDARALCSNIDANLSSVISGHNRHVRTHTHTHTQIMCVPQLKHSQAPTHMPDVVQSKQEQTNVDSLLWSTISHSDDPIFRRYTKKSGCLSLSAKPCVTLKVTLTHGSCSVRPNSYLLDSSHIGAAGGEEACLRTPRWWKIREG